MLKILSRLLLGPAARAGGQVLDADARLAVPPRALGAADGPRVREKVIPGGPSGSRMTDNWCDEADQKGAPPTVH